MNLLEQKNPEQKESRTEREHTRTKEHKSGKEQEWQEPKSPVILIMMSIIVVLLLCILVLLILSPGRKKDSEQDSSEALQQSMLDYANEQKQNDKPKEEPSQGVIVVDSSVEPEASEHTTEEVTGQEEAPKAPDTSENGQSDTLVIESNTIDKTAIIVDIEDENDVSYTKEFIMNEMMPYFEQNNLDAIWDLAHLKRYVKLSAGLKNSDSYYYKGGVDVNGKPDGIGLAIYENNTYYYGSWSHGVRSGDGRWWRFYIDDIGAKTTKKKFQSHSYSGAWSNDLPNGQGSEHYDVDISQLSSKDRVIQNVVGNFTNGLYDGEMYANTIDYTGNVEEWGGTAHQGVLDLWRDMSSIGECSVWQNKQDNDLYLDIDKSENKNQGMRELLVNRPAK